MLIKRCFDYFCNSLEIEMKTGASWRKLDDNERKAQFMFIVADYEHCQPGETKDVANSNELKIINEKNYNFSLTQSRNKKCARDDHE